MVGIDFAGPPTSGMTLTNTNSCGEVGIAYGPAVVSMHGIFQASEPGMNLCFPAQDAGGSWTLTFTSMSSPDIESDGVSYFPHGTLVATMPDGMGDTGMASFNF
jgi:2-keto-3-deoxy-6-phosphogluconate aldolase